MANTKKQFDVIYRLYKMKQSHWLLNVAKNCELVQENHATVNLDSSVPSRGIETYGKKQKFKNIEETAGKVKSVFVIAHPCELKNLDVALNISGVEKICSENLRLRSI